MDEFEIMLRDNLGAVERFVKLRIPLRADAEDILQEVCITAYQKFDTLKNRSAFKAWIISIARNQCNDWYRKQNKCVEIPVENVAENLLAYDGRGRTSAYFVEETLSLLNDNDKQILYLYYWAELSQTEIAARLSLPLGTVKSRLHRAKQNFKACYPCHPIKPEGEIKMKSLPENRPEYKIVRSDVEPFAVKWEELLGLFIVPKVGESLIWGSYETDGSRHEWGELNVSGKAEIHGLECVEINEIRHENGKSGGREFNYYAQLTDTHCRMLAERYQKDGVRKMLTFLDGDDFAAEWGYGEDNCGRETNISAKGNIVREGSTVTAANIEQLFDIIGRYTVTIGEKNYDTVCVMGMFSYYGNYIAIEQYLDENGRTILWRRFNRDDWYADKYGKRWTELMPNNERITINNETYVHWYDCITDYVV